MADVATDEDDATLDAFHRGAFWLAQPRRGHRAGMDAMVLAAAVPGDFAGSLADLGAGAGAAGLAVAARRPQTQVALVERSPDMIGFARRSMALPQNERLTERVRIIEADVTLTGRQRAAAGLADDEFDFAIMNPPFNIAADRATPDALRRAAHVMDDGLLEAWMRTAAAIVRPRGGMAVIARPASLAELLAAVGQRFGSVRICPIHPRADAPAIRVILRGVRGSRAGIEIAPPLILHEPGSDRFRARADAIINGAATLFGD